MVISQNKIMFEDDEFDPLSTHNQSKFPTLVYFMEFLFPEIFLLLNLLHLRGGDITKFPF